MEKSAGVGQVPAEDEYYAMYGSRVLISFPGESAMYLPKLKSECILCLPKDSSGNSDWHHLSRFDQT